MTSAHWDWSRFVGDRECLRYARRDLETLDLLIAEHLCDWTVAVQAGGNLGVFAKRLAEEFEAVYTFEPDPTLFGNLCANVVEPNVFKLQAALGSSHGTIGLSSARRDGSSRPTHPGLTHVAGPGFVPMLLIDDLALDACALIYLDVEGYELEALRGGRETIETHRPLLAIEVNKQIEHAGSSADELHAFLTEIGYRQLLALHSDEVWTPS